MRAKIQHIGGDWQGERHVVAGEAVPVRLVATGQCSPTRALELLARQLVFARRYVGPPKPWASPKTKSPPSYAAYDHGQPGTN